MKYEYKTPVVGGYLIPPSDATEIVIWGSAALTRLYASGCAALTHLDVRGCAALAYLDVRGCAALTHLGASGCAALTHLDVRGCAALTHLGASGCAALTNLGVRGCAALTHLDVGGCEALTNLGVRDCAALTHLDVRGCAALAYLDASGCKSSIMPKMFLDLVPKLDNPEATLLRDIEDKKYHLDMARWAPDADSDDDGNVCGTTCCHAGGLVFEAKILFDLVEKYSYATLGAAVFAKAYPDGRIPDFYTTESNAIAEMKMNAGIE